MPSIITPEVGAFYRLLTAFHLYFPAVPAESIRAWWTLVPDLRLRWGRLNS